MSLFGKSNVQADAENMLATNFANGDLLREIITAVSYFSGKKEHDWLMKAQSYYDNRMRTAVIDKNGVLVLNLPLSAIQNNAKLKKRLERAYWFGNDAKFSSALAASEESEKELSSVEGLYLDYTMFGFEPLPAHYRKDRVFLTQGDLLALWAKVIYDTVSAKAPHLKFEQPVRVDDFFAIPYEVPCLNWKRWF